MHRQSTQRGFILLPVVLAITLIAAIAFLINTESAINVNMTASTTAAVEAEQVARSGLAHATWGIQNSGCAGDMGMMTVPFGQAGTDNYTATVTTPGGATTGYPDLVSDQDAWFRSDNITTNNGTNTTYHLRMESGDLEYAVVRFDLSSLPAGAQINSAQARFYVANGKGHPEGPVTVHRVTADWTETGATWETMGDQYDSAVLDTIPAQPDAGDVRVAVNLTAQVQAWVNGGEPNYGIMLIPTGEGTHAEYISREGAASQQPRLDVIVGSGLATPATIQVTGTLTGNPSPANDITRTLTRTDLPAYQPSSSATLQADPEGQDAMIHQWKADWNYGSGTSLNVQDWGSDSDYHSLLQFNLGRIPHGAKIYSARLALYQNTSSTAGGSVGVHRITGDWVEGSGNGSTAPGVTWNERTNGVAWTTPGGDFDAEAYASTTIPAGAQDWFTWDVTALVSGWVGSTFPNQGLVLVPESAGAHAIFESSDATDPTLRPRLTVTYACECGSTCFAPQGSGNVLLVVVNPTTLVPDDAFKKALFESWGYKINLISESANQAVFDSDATLNDVVYVSSTVNANNLGDKLNHLPIGVVSEDGDYNPDLGFATGAAWTVGSAVNLTDTSHYITAPFAAGPLDIYSAGMEQLTVSGTEGPALQTLADTGGAGSLVVLDTGAMGAGGTPVAGRRVMLPLGRDGNFNWDYLNTNGRLMVQRALQWGTGNIGGAPPKNLLLVVADAASLSTRSAGRKTLMESWGYTVTLIDDGDSQANFDIAMAANDVVYVTDTVSGPTLVDKVTNTTTPVVNEKGSKLGNFGFSSSESGTVNAAGFTSTDAAHYITEPFSGNPVTVFSSSLSMGVPGGTLAPDLQNVGDVSGTPALATLEDGATLWNGGSAPARRAHVPLGAAETTQLTADGETLMRRAIEWAEGAVATTTLPIAHWKLDEPSGINAVDSAGGHDGTLTNGPTWGAGQVGGALSFDGSNDFVDVPYDAALSLTQEMTFTSWVKATSFGSGYQAIISTDTPGNGASNYWFGTWQSELVFGFWADSAFRTVQSTGLNLQPDTWYHLAATFDNATDQVRLYLDGAQVQAGSITFEPTPETANIWIGHSVDGEYWPGMLDEVRIYDQVLDAADIAELAAESDSSALSVLLIVGNLTLSSKDVGYKALIESWGHTVSLIDDGDSQANYDTAMDAADVILASGSAVGSSILDKPTNTPKGLVNEVNGKIDNFGFSSSTSATANFNAFSKTDAAHYITEPFSGNPVTVFTTALTNPVPGGTLAPDLSPVGEVSGTLALGTLDTGATRYDSNPSPGRRAHLPFAAAETTDMTDDGKIILQRTLEWAAGAGSGGGGGGGGGPTGVVFEGFTEALMANGTSLAIDKPTGTASGDLLVAAVATDGNTVGSLAPPAGWTVVDLTTQGGAVTFAVWWKLAGASESSTYTFAWSGNEHAYGWVMRFSGHDPASPIDASTNTGGTSSSPSSPAVTTTVADALVLRLGGFDDDDIDTGVPGPAGHTAINMGDSGNGPATASGGSGYVLQTTAGSSGTSNFTLTGNEEYRAVTIAIRPAP